MKNPTWGGVLVALTIGFLAGAITIGVAVREAPDGGLRAPAAQRPRRRAERVQESRRGSERGGACRRTAPAAARRASHEPGAAALGWGPKRTN